MTLLQTYPPTGHRRQCGRPRHRIDARTVRLPKPKFRIVTLAEQQAATINLSLMPPAPSLSNGPQEQLHLRQHSHPPRLSTMSSSTQYNLFLQLNHAPYAWGAHGASRHRALHHPGQSGWVGSITLRFSATSTAYPMSPWFSQFMGGIRYTHYLPNFAKAPSAWRTAATRSPRTSQTSFVIDKRSGTRGTTPLAPTFAYRHRRRVHLAHPWLRDNRRLVTLHSMAATRRFHRSHLAPLLNAL